MLGDDATLPSPFPTRRPRGIRRARRGGLLSIAPHTPVPGRSRPLILHIEDDADVRRAYAAILERRGYDVLEAEDVAGGLEIARTRLPDVVLLDVQLPGPSGWNAARVIKEDPLMHRIAVIVVTGMVSDVDRDASYAAGCDLYLEKPVPAQLLLDSVATILRERGVMGPHA